MPEKEESALFQALIPFIGVTSSFPCAAWERSTGCVASTALWNQPVNLFWTGCNASRMGSHAAHGNQKHEHVQVVL